MISNKIGIDQYFTKEDMERANQQDQKKTNDASNILRSVASMIETRAADRDIEKERSMHTAVELFQVITFHSLTEYEGWLFMACLKLARNRKGTGIFNEDHLIDAIAYLALALESKTTQC